MTTLVNTPWVWQWKNFNVGKYSITLWQKLSFWEPVYRAYFHYYNLHPKRFRFETVECLQVVFPDAQTTVSKHSVQWAQWNNIGIGITDLRVTRPIRCVRVKWSGRQVLWSARCVRIAHISDQSLSKVCQSTQQRSSIPIRYLVFAACTMVDNCKT